MHVFCRYKELYEKVSRRNQCLWHYCDLNDIPKGFHHFPLAFVKGVVGAEVDLYTAVKTGIFSCDMYRTGMVISVGKVYAVHAHQRFCALVSVYHPTLEVLDHDVV